MKRFNTTSGGFILLSSLAEALNLDSIIKINDAADVSAHRINQIQASQNLVTHFVEKSPTIRHELNGKPFLDQTNLGISISHSSTHIAVLIIQKAASCGIDIESNERQITRLARKFTTPKELSALEKIDSHNKPLLLWTLKECLFKTINTSGVDFKSHLNLISATQENEEILAVCEINHPSIKGRLFTKSFIFDNHIVTYCDTPLEK